MEGTNLMNLTLKESAIGMHEMYINFQEAGFTKKEAFKLVLAIVGKHNG
jgi:hypothetical protein